MWRRSLWHLPTYLLQTRVSVAAMRPPFTPTAFVQKSGMPSMQRSREAIVPVAMRDAFCVPSCPQPAVYSEHVHEQQQPPCVPQPHGVEGPPPPSRIAMFPVAVKHVALQWYLLPMWVCTLGEGVASPLCYELHVCASPWHLGVMVTLCTSAVFGLPQLLAWATQQVSPRMGMAFAIALAVTHVSFVVQCAHPGTRAADVCAVAGMLMWTALLVTCTCARNSATPLHRAGAVAVLGFNIALALLVAVLALERYKALVLTMGMVALAVLVFLL